MPGFLTDDLRKFILTMCEDIATPRSATVAILLRYDEFDQLATLQTDPHVYLDGDKFLRDSAVTSFFEETPGSSDYLRPKGRGSRELLQLGT